MFADFSVLLGVMLLIAFLTETLIEFAKVQLEAYLNERQIQGIAAVIGVLLAWLLHADLFVTNNIGLMIVGYLIVGFVSSRGASYIHNWFDKLPRK